MRDRDQACIGGVLSADIAVPNHAKQVAFYRTLLTSGSNPLWRDDLLSRDGTPIIGLGERTPEYGALPLQWMPHIHVADVAGAVDAAQRLGGKVLLHEKDDSGASAWAVLVDPEGAAFGVVPVVTSDQLPPQEATISGRIRGLRLISSDPDAAAAYYAQVVGWSLREGDDSATGPRELVLANATGTPVARIERSATPTDLSTGLWLLGLPVADLEASLRHVAPQGGRIRHVEADDKQTPLRAIIQDPENVCFQLVRGA